MSLICPTISNNSFYWIVCFDHCKQIESERDRDRETMRSFDSFPLCMFQVPSLPQKSGTALFVWCIHSSSATQPSQQCCSMICVFISRGWILMSEITEPYISLCLTMWESDRMLPKVAAPCYIPQSGILRILPFISSLTFMWLFNINSSSYEVVGFSIGGLWYKARFPIFTDFVSLEGMCVKILQEIFHFCHLTYYWAACLHKYSRCKSLRTYVQKQEQVFAHF